MKIDSALRSAISTVPEVTTAPQEPSSETQPLPVPPLPPATAQGGSALRRRRARRSLSPGARLWVVVALVALALVLLLRVHTVLRPFIWAGVVAYILNPLVSLIMRRTGLRRGLSVTTVMLAGVGLLVWGAAASVPILRTDIVNLADALGNLAGYLTTALPNAGNPTVLGIPIQVTSVVHNAQSIVNDLPHLILHDGAAVITTAVDSLLHFLTFLITTFYLLLDGPRLRTWLREKLPESARDEVAGVATQVNTVLTDYLRAEVILIALMSAISLLVLSVLGVHFALLLAPVVGFLEIFPIVGPFLAITLVTAVALIGPPGYGLSRVAFAVIVALIFFVLRQIEDYLVIPRVVGHAVKLHPVIILFALLCGATMGGILGMFLAVPVTGAIKVVGSYIYDRLVE